MLKLREVSLFLYKILIVYFANSNAQVRSRPINNHFAIEDSTDDVMIEVDALRAATIPPNFWEE
jgi:hypothetical protein